MGKAFSEEERQEVQEKLRVDFIHFIKIRMISLKICFFFVSKKKRMRCIKKERRHLMIRKVLSQVLSITKVCTLNRIRHLLTVKAIL